MAIEVDGKIYRNLPEQVEENANQIEDLKAKFSSLGTVMRYKGSVATYDDLPTEDLQIGDVYNVLDTGSNYAWDGEEWDEIGSTVDLSGLVTLDTDQTILGVKTFDKPITTTAGFTWGDYSSTTWILKLGTTTLMYGNVGDVYINTNLVPPTDSSKSLGNTSRYWKDLYLGGKIDFNSVFTVSNDSNNYFDIQKSGNTVVKLGTNNSFVNSHWLPFNNNSNNLGSSTFTWKDIYLSGSINLGVFYVSIGSNNQVEIGRLSSKFQIYPAEIITDTLRLRPQVANTTDLGVSTVPYKDLYLSGNLSDGTNSVTVAELAWKEIAVSNISSISQINLATNIDFVIVRTGTGVIPAGTKEVVLEIDNIGTINATTIITSVGSIAFVAYTGITITASDIAHIYYK